MIENEFDRVADSINTQDDEAVLLRLIEAEAAKGVGPYSQRKKGLNNFAGLLAGAGNLFSFFTQAFAFAFFLQGNLAPTLGGVWAWVVGAVLGALLSGLIEFGKRMINNELFYEVVFKRNWPFGLLATALILGALSTSVSFYASLSVPRAVRGEPVAAVNRDSVVNRWDSQINRLMERQKALDDPEGQFWVFDATQGKKLLKYELWGEQAALPRKIDSLMGLREQALGKADAQNAAAKANGYAEQEQQGHALAYFSMFLEICFIFAMRYRKQYLHKSIQERGGLDKFVKSSTLPQDEALARAQAEADRVRAQMAQMEREQQQQAEQQRLAALEAEKRRLAQEQAKIAADRQRAAEELAEAKLRQQQADRQRLEAEKQALEAERKRLAQQELEKARKAPPAGRKIGFEYKAPTLPQGVEQEPPQTKDPLLKAEGTKNAPQGGEKRPEIITKYIGAHVKTCTCEECGEVVARKRKNQRFCSKECRRKWHKKNNK